MPESKELAKRNGGRQISDDPLAMMIVSLINAMRFDFGHKFTSVFPDKETLRVYKRRVYAQCRNGEVEDLANGYELYLSGRPEWPPSWPVLLGHVDQARNDRVKALQNKLEAERVAALPPPSVECDPVAMFAEAKAKADALPADRDERRSQLLQLHNATLSAHSDKIKHIYAQHEQSCAVGFCKSAGVLSASTKGDGNFYCREHFREYS